ncbi:Phosphoribosyl 1,2-cyclic phosphodiesterase [Anaerocolumna jejuensis DSM 15929]|uniref:Phosphoribosyl 1,2-cyclic phosphodiesterase n=1 Tax=Anaerocolumna jejuensis DSM 15929 TaxID=1121322 RepID=A0A1M6MMI6_9FIRM|nr:MBL fold metallo-hydrolase [Anaerocolumna jejuensis]SHJ84677.1 Phosphoribosyl 1,2-cyclic phosphodiesterase [Anaerocolumna jejuensis DSM 15929]
MKNFQFIFLGTGAADWAYHPQGDLKFDRGSKLRRTSSLWINGHILIDPAPEAFFFAKNVLKLDLSQLTDIFLTHSHEDHFDREALSNFILEAEGKVHFFCHESMVPYLQLDKETLYRTELRPLKVQKPVMLDELQVMPLAANHEVAMVMEAPLHYEFELGGERILYGCDGGWFLAGTWSYLMGRDLDAVILDATVGDYADDFRIASHNTLPMIRMLLPAMKRNHVLKENGSVILSHFARTLHDSIEETEVKLKAEGMICAFDGMVL